MDSINNIIAIILSIIAYPFFNYYLETIVLNVIILRFKQFVYVKSNQNTKTNKKYGVEVPNNVKYKYFV